METTKAFSLYLTLFAIYGIRAQSAIDTDCRNTCGLIPTSTIFACPTNVWDCKVNFLDASAWEPPTDTDCMYRIKKDNFAFFFDGKDKYAISNVQCNKQNKLWNFSSRERVNIFKITDVKLNTGNGFHVVTAKTSSPVGTSDNCVEELFPLQHFGSTSSRACPDNVVCKPYNRSNIYSAKQADESCSMFCNNGNHPMYYRIADGHIRMADYIYIRKDKKTYIKAANQDILISSSAIQVACADGEGRVEYVPYVAPVVPKNCVKGACGYPNFQEGNCPAGLKCSPLTPWNSVFDNTTCLHSCPKSSTYFSLDTGVGFPFKGFSCDGSNQMNYYLDPETAAKKGVRTIICVEGVESPVHSPAEVANFKKSRCDSLVNFPLSNANYRGPDGVPLTPFFRETTYTTLVDGVCRVYCDNGGSGILALFSGAVARNVFIQYNPTKNNYLLENGKTIGDDTTLLWCLPNANPNDLIVPTEQIPTTPGGNDITTCGCHEPPFVIPSEIPPSEMNKLFGKHEIIGHVKQTKTADGYKYACGSRDRSDTSTYAMFTLDAYKAGQVLKHLEYLECKSDGVFRDQDGTPIESPILCLKTELGDPQ